MTHIHKKLGLCFAALTAMIYRFKYWVLTCLLLVTFALASHIPKLKIDTRDESFFHDDDPTLITYNKFRDEFGQDDTFIIGLKPQDGLTPTFLASLYQIHKDLEASTPYLDDITSLVNGRIVRAEGDTLIVEDLMERPPESDMEMNRILNLIDHYPLYENLLVSADRTIFTILIKAEAVKEVSEDEALEGFDEDTPRQTNTRHVYLSNEENVEIHNAIRETMKKYEGRGIEFYYAGTPAFVAEFQESIEKDLGRMIPLSLIMIVLFLLLLFRRISGVIYPMIVVFCSVIASFGIMALIGIPITLATQILPLFLIVVGIGDSVHILTIFYRSYCAMNDKHQAITETVGHVGLPILMTSLTTACGLFSFVWADVGSVAQLGIVAPIGVLLALFYSVFLLPALIAIFPVKQMKPASRDKYPFPDRLFDAIAGITTRRPLLVVSISLIIILSAACGALFVRMSHNALTWFPEKNTIRVSSETLDRVNGGTVMLEVLIDSTTEKGLHNPDLLKRLDEAASFISGFKVDGIQAGKAWSMADVLKEINRALHEDTDEAYIVPGTRKMIAQELILFESSGSDDMEDLVESSYQTGRLSILAPFTDAILYKDYVDQIKAYLARKFPFEKVSLTGHMVLFIHIIKNTIISMVKSYSFSLLVITLLMVLMIGRLRIGLMSMIANMTPIVCIFGIMGIFDVPLDMSTILVGSLVLGLVVDDTIHFLHHFREAYEETSHVEAAVRETLFSTGRALVITSLVLCGGFFIYMTSYLANNIRFGLLTGCAVIFALAADFFLVPALLSLVYQKKVFSSDMTTERL
ncbi:MAG: MMPL family transporter [Desulfatiglans sp.]|jgi:predicted RND superfamily exporter protein|nr:MMPL family transporter [Desulfatiglans sp.]